MLRFGALFLVVLVAMASSAPIESVDKEWQDFKVQYNKSYSTDVEEAKRKTIFGNNLQTIIWHNALHDAGYGSYHLGINEYADMSHHEFVAIMNGFHPLPHQRHQFHQHPHRRRHRFRRLPPCQHPDYCEYLFPPHLRHRFRRHRRHQRHDNTTYREFDWRMKGYVTEVKNQRKCGSSWAFSATGSLEGQLFRKTGKLVSLSEQNLVDCSTLNDGCGGGTMDEAFQFIRDNNGLNTEASYPYLGENNQCDFKTEDIGATIIDYNDIPSHDENKLMEALATVGPISVAIDASNPSFQHYKGGVYDEPDCNSNYLDHAVLAVGYGTSDEGGDYWIIKNSWGLSWGENGYMRMVRNRENKCGIATAASYPVV